MPVRVLAVQAVIQCRNAGDCRAVTCLGASKSESQVPCGIPWRSLHILACPIDSELMIGSLLLVTLACASGHGIFQWHSWWHCHWQMTRMMVDLKCGCPRPTLLKGEVNQYFTLLCRSCALDIVLQACCSALELPVWHPSLSPICVDAQFITQPIQTWNLYHIMMFYRKDSDVCKFQKSSV